MQVNVQPVYVPGLQGEATASGTGDAASNNNIIQVRQQLDLIILQTCGHVVCTGITFCVI